MTALDGGAPRDETAESRNRHEETLTRLARGGSLNLVGAAVSGAVGVLMVVVVARAMDVTAAGSFFAATSIFLIVVAVVELGADTGLVRFLPKYLVERATVTSARPCGSRCCLSPSSRSSAPSCS